MARGLPRKITKRNELHARRSQEFYHTGSNSSSNANSAENLNVTEEAQQLQAQAIGNGSSQSTTPVPGRKKGKKRGGNRGANRSQEALDNSGGQQEDSLNRDDGNGNGESGTVDTMQVLSAIDSIIGSSSSAVTTDHRDGRGTGASRSRQAAHISGFASATRKKTRSHSPSSSASGVDALRHDAGVCHLDMNANDPLFFSAPNPYISPRSKHQAWVQIAPNASANVPSSPDLDKSLPGTWVSSNEGLNDRTNVNYLAEKPTTVDIHVIPVTDILADDSAVTSNDDISSLINEPPHSPQSKLSSRSASPAVSTSEVYSTVTEPATSPKPAATSSATSSTVSPTTEFNEGPLSPPPTPAVVQDVFKGNPPTVRDEDGAAISPVGGTGPGTPPPTPFTTVNPHQAASPSLDAVKAAWEKDPSPGPSPTTESPCTPPPTPFTTAPGAQSAAASSTSTNPSGSISPPSTRNHVSGGGLGIATTPESMEQLGVMFAHTESPIPTPLQSRDFAFKQPAAPIAAAAPAMTPKHSPQKVSRSPSPSSTAMILHPGTALKSRSPSPSPPPPTSRSRQASVTLGLSGNMLRHTLLLPTTSTSTSPCTSPALKAKTGPSM